MRKIKEIIIKTIWQDNAAIVVEQKKFDKIEDCLPYLEAQSDWEENC